ATALLDLGLVEALDVVRQQRRDDGVLGLPGLQQGAAGLLAASGAAGRLAQKLECVLGRARIAIGEPDVGVDDSNERQPREIMALGDKLSADDDVVIAAPDRVQLATQPLDAATGVGRQNETSRVGKQQLRLLGDALDAGATGGQRIGLLTNRAGGGLRLGVAAMVTQQRL